MMYAVVGRADKNSLIPARQAPDALRMDQDPISLGQGVHEHDVDRSETQQGERDKKQIAVEGHQH